MMTRQHQQSSAVLKPAAGRYSEAIYCIEFSKKLKRGHGGPLLWVKTLWKDTCADEDCRTEGL